MAQTAASLISLLSLTLLLLLHPVLIYAGNEKSVNDQRSWCVARPSADDAALRNNLDYACSVTGCKPLDKSSPCFLPDNLISHASVAMNQYYQAMGRNSWNCYFNGTGLISITDPSYGSCRF